MEEDIHGATFPDTTNANTGLPQVLNCLYPVRVDHQSVAVFVGSGYYLYGHSSVGIGIYGWYQADIGNLDIAAG
ncbi:hypothetical protein ES703_10872 [subsurface metagenome]